MNLKRIPGFLFILLLTTLPAMAQTTASLTGTVTAEGAAIPGVLITVTSPNLQGSRTANTDINGNYNFTGLPPGDYTVRFEMEGMQGMTRGVRVSLAQTARADAALHVSTIKESLTVTAAAPTVVETTEIQTNFSQKTVEKLPLSRTLIGTIDVAPGTTRTGPGGATMISGAG